MKRITFDEEKGRVLLFTHYTDRRRAAQLPYARWRGKQKCWSAELTPAVWAVIRRWWPEESEEAEAENDRIKEVAGKLDQRIEVRQRDDPDKADYSYVTEPWEHQIAATRFTRDMDAALLHCFMGTGKSKITLDAAANRGHKHLIIICPASVIDVWQDEIFKHRPGVWHVLPLPGGNDSVADRAEKLELAVDRYDRVAAILNYEATWREPMDQTLLSRRWPCVIWDESHRIKSPGSKQSWFAAKIDAEHKIALTGTPLPHSPLDLYGQYRALDVGIFGSRYGRFRDRYARMGGYQGKQVVGFRNRGELKEQMDRLRHYIPKDALDLPEMQIIDRTCQLSQEAKARYEELESMFITEVEEGVVTAANALAKLIRLSQIAAGFTKTESGEIVPVGSAKRNLLKDLLTDMGDERAVIFTRFRRDLDTIREVADELDRDCLEISGRVKQYRDWKQGGGDTIAVQTQAGSLGIDLTEARYAIFYTLGYSLGDFEQAKARVHRPGQDREVVIYRLLAKATVDRSIVRALDRRKDVIDSIIEEVEEDEWAKVSANT